MTNPDPTGGDTLRARHFLEAERLLDVETMAAELPVDYSFNELRANIETWVELAKVHAMLADVPPAVADRAAALAAEREAQRRASEQAAAELLRAFHG